MQPTKPDNPPAFARSAAFGDGCHDWGSEGMTMRDYFAIRCPDSEVPKLTMGSEEMLLRMRCNARYAYADAMLAAREATNDK